MHDDIRGEAMRAGRTAHQLGLSQKQIAEATRHSQSQVSRVLSGRTARRSKAFRDVCSYVFFRATTEPREAVRNNSELIDALAEVWDGTPDHSAALACVIRSLGSLTRPLRGKHD